jgi:hypothetical protein
MLQKLKALAANPIGLYKYYLYKSMNLSPIRVTCQRKIHCLKYFRESVPILKC